MANEIFEEDPLEYGDSLESKRTTKKSESDQVAQATDSINTRTGSTATDTIDSLTDSFTAQATKVYPDIIPQPTESVDIAKAQSNTDAYDTGIGEDLTTLRHHHETGVLPRLDASKVETDAQAVDYFYNEVIRRFRFNKYDMMIDAPTNRLEVEDALSDALSDMNNYLAPHTRWSLLDILKKTHRYHRLLILMCGKNLLFTLWSESSINEIEVSIEDFGLEPRTSNIKDMYDTVAEVVESMLQEMKGYDRLSVKYSPFSTGLRRTGGKMNSLSVRTSRIIRNGGIIG